MKPSPITVTISFAGIVLAALSLYLGALLPYLKGRSYIDAERRLASVRSVDGFKQSFDQSFGFYSPIGDEEIAKFLGSNVLTIINQGQPDDVSHELAAYAEEHLYKDDVRHLMTLGHLYRALWIKFDNEADYQKAVTYFAKAHEIGPNLPPPLYALFNLYAIRKDKANLERIGAIIMTNWPQDEETRAVLEQAKKLR